MQISFNGIPSGWRVPGAYAEISNKNAVQGLVGKPFQVLIFGQMDSVGGSSAVKVPQLVSTADEGKALFGDSMLSEMIAMYRENDPFTKLMAVGLADAGGSAAMARDVVFTGPATGAGTLFMYIGGVRLAVGVANGDTATAVAANVAAAITAESKILFTAAAATGTLTLTAKHKGEAANDVDVRFNYYAGESFPAGVSATVSAPSTPGAGNPQFDADVLPVVGDEWFDAVVSPYTDAANLAAIAVELADRFGPMRAIDGVGFVAAVSNHAGLITLGDGQNSPHLSIMESYAYPVAPYVRAAGIAAQVVKRMQNDPARPVQRLTVKGDMAPALEDRFTAAERNLLLNDGISTCTVDAGNNVQIERVITTYQENSGGSPDPSYLNIETMYTLSYLRYSWRARVLQKFPDFKLGDDGARGDFVMTPKLMRAEMVALAGDWADAGLIESVESFKENLQVSRSGTDVDRLDMVLPPDLINQLRVVAARIDFRL